MTDTNVLRDALHTHIDPAQPPADLFTGVRRRARRIRRNRVAGSVASSALAVALIAAAVPVVADGDRAPRGPMVASGGSPGAQQQPPRGLTPADPWGYRGDPAVLEDGTVEKVKNRPDSNYSMQSGDRFVPLYGKAAADGAPTVLVFLIARVDGSASWGAAQVGDGEVTVSIHVELAPGTAALVAPLAGAAGSEVLVVAYPDAAEIEYAHSDASEWVDLTMVDAGVATTWRDSDSDSDMVRVLDSGGKVVHQQAAPDLAGASQPRHRTTAAPLPDGVGESQALAFDPARPWPFRGDGAARAAVATQVWDAWLAQNGQGERGSSDAQALWAGVLDRTGRRAVVLAARQTDRSPWTVVIGQDTPSGAAEVLESRQLTGTHLVIDAVLPGDDVPYLLGLAHPGTDLRWSPTGTPDGQRSGGGRDTSVSMYDTGVDTSSRWYVRKGSDFLQQEPLDVGGGKLCHEGEGTC